MEETVHKHRSRNYTPYMKMAITLWSKLGREWKAMQMQWVVKSLRQGQVRWTWGTMRGAGWVEHGGKRWVKGGEIQGRQGWAQRWAGAVSWGAPAFSRAPIPASTLTEDPGSALLYSKLSTFLPDYALFQSRDSLFPRVWCSVSYIIQTS